MIQYELKVLPGLQTLRKLDLRGNTVGSLRKLAVLAGLPDLRDLQLDGGSPGNSICAVPGYRSAVAQALPQLQLLDRLPLDDERECLSQQQGPAAQHIAELQLQAYQPQTEAPGPEEQLAAEPMSEAADRGHVSPYTWPVPMPYLQGMAALPQDLTYQQCMQQLPSLPRAPGLPEALAKDDVQNLADRLAQHLPQSRAVLPEEAADSAKQERRWASMEARLSALLEGKLPLSNQNNVTRAIQPRNWNMSETAAQLAENMRESTSQRQQHVRQDSRCSGPQIASPAVQRLQKDAEDLRAQLQSVRGEITSVTQRADAERSEYQAKLHRMQSEADNRVIDLKRQASKALKHMRQQLLSAQQQRDELARKVEEASGERLEMSREVASLRLKLTSAAQQADGYKKELGLAQAFPNPAEQHNAVLAGMKQEISALQTELTQAKASMRLRQDAAEESSRQEIQVMQDALVVAGQVKVDLHKAQAALHEEVSKWQSRALEATDAAAQAKAREDAAAQQLASLQTQLCDAVALAEGKRVELDGASEQLQACQESLRECQAGAARKSAAGALAEAKLQQALAAAEADFRASTQEQANEIKVLQEKVTNLTEAEGQLRRDLEVERNHAKEKEADTCQLAEVAHRQKACIAALQKERTDLVARSADPAQVAALRAEAAALQRRLQELSGLKAQLAEERGRRGALEAEARTAREAARVQQASARADVERLRERLCAAEHAAAASEKSASDIKAQLHAKETRLKQAERGVEELQAALEAAQQDAVEAATSAQRADKELRTQQSLSAQHQRLLRQEAEEHDRAMTALEAALDEARSQARSRDQKLSVATKELKEKDEMLKYVVEEVDRVKAMYEDRLARMTAEREAAREAAQSAERQFAERLSAAELRAEKAGVDARVATDALAELQKHLGALPQQLEAADTKSRNSEEAAAQKAKEAARAHRRVAEVEAEMRSLLMAMERQKRVSAAKMQELASVVHDLQTPFLSWRPPTLA
ncbi:g849 [Coccomyxa viridis]|uniref:G849 protein n=1 Tax=Coccomyxa viridis TaxID=1274662 RepID=A0ABP1FGN8_9CHLO